MWSVLIPSEGLLNFTVIMCKCVWVYTGKYRCPDGSEAVAPLELVIGGCEPLDMSAGN